MATEGDCPICLIPLSVSPVGTNQNNPSTSTNTHTHTHTHQKATGTTITATTTTSCSHTFHATCLYDWTDPSSGPRRSGADPATCPLCREPLPPSSFKPRIRVSRPDGWRAWVELTPQGVCERARARTPDPEGRLVRFSILRHFVYSVPGDGGGDPVEESLRQRVRVDIDAAAEAMRKVLDLIAELPRFDVSPLCQFMCALGGAHPLRAYYTNFAGFNINSVELCVFPPATGPIGQWERAERFRRGRNLGSLSLPKRADLMSKRVKDRLMEEMLAGRVHPFRCEWVYQEGGGERRGEFEALEDGDELLL